MDIDTVNVDRLWTVEEVAKYLGVPVKTLYYWRHQGSGPRSSRLGKHLRYRAQDVLSWIEAQTSAG